MYGISSALLYRRGSKHSVQDTTIGNVVSGSARSKETLEWLSNDIFGKVVLLKKGVTLDRDKPSINHNENMDSLVPASKISDMPTGWVCGQVARDFGRRRRSMVAA